MGAVSMRNEACMTLKGRQERPVQRQRVAPISEANPRPPEVRYRMQHPYPRLLRRPHSSSPPIPPVAAGPYRDLAHQRQPGLPDQRRRLSVSPHKTHGEASHVTATLTRNVSQHSRLGRCALHSERSGEFCQRHHMGPWFDDHSDSDWPNTFMASTLGR